MLSPDVCPLVVWGSKPNNRTTHVATFFEGGQDAGSIPARSTNFPGVPAVMSYSWALPGFYYGIAYRAKINHVVRYEQRGQGREKEGMMPQIGNSKKKWSERNEVEKIEVLKNELSRTQRELSRVCNYVNKLIDHDHLRGKVVQRVGSPNEESYGGLHCRIEEFD